MIKFAVILPVGPDPQELERTSDLLHSLWAYEPHTSWVVLIDDTTHDRRLTERFYFPPTCQAVSLPNPRQGRGNGHRGGVCAALLTGLNWVHSHTDASFALKLDTDALVITPFAEKIQTAFAAMPQVGMLGSYDQTCNGDRRDFSFWQPCFEHLSSRLSLFRFRGKRYFHLGLIGRGASIRQQIQTALKQGYEWGEHCQGGAYAVSRKMILRMAEQGYLNDPLLWLHTPMGDDPMLGMYTKATAMQLHGLVAIDQPFGIRLKGLAYLPEELLAKGHSLIHSVKNDARLSESEIRSFFREHRLTATEMSKKSLASSMEK